MAADFVVPHFISLLQVSCLSEDQTAHSNPPRAAWQIFLLALERCTISMQTTIPMHTHSGALMSSHWKYSFKWYLQYFPKSVLPRTGKPLNSVNNCITGRHDPHVNHPVALAGSYDGFLSWEYSRRGRDNIQQGTKNTSYRQVLCAINIQWDFSAWCFDLIVLGNLFGRRQSWLNFIAVILICYRAWPKAPTMAFLLYFSQH